jgi:hypothetical protein
MADQAFETRFEELSKRQRTRSSLRLLAWSVPVLLAVVLLWLARDEASLIDDGVAAAPAVQELREGLGSARSAAERLDSTLGDARDLAAEEVLGSGAAGHEGPVTVVEALSNHGERLVRLEASVAAEEPPPTRSTAGLSARDAARLDDVAAGQDRVARELASRQGDLDALRADLGRLGAADDARGAALERRLEEAVARAGALQARVEKLEAETAYRSLTVREGHRAPVLSLGLTLAPGKVSGDLLPGFTVADQQGRSIPLDDPRVALSEPNGFDYAGCKYRFAVTRHKRSLLLPDYLDIELLRSCPAVHE